MSNQSRRNFLKMLGLSTTAYMAQSPLQLILANMIDGLVFDAKAHAAGQNPRRYLLIQQPGANPRWTFDLPLTPYSSAGFVANPHLGTKYTGSTRYTGTTYSTFSFTHNSGERINLPHLWQFDIPRASGGTRPMTDLLDHFLCIRGINTNNAGHSPSQEQQFRPLGSTVTLGGLVADASVAPLNAIAAGASNYIFKSRTGKSSGTIALSGNVMSTIVSPFQPNSNSGFKNDKALLQNLIDRSLSSLADMADAGHPDAVTLINSRMDAEELFKRNLQAIAAQWDSVFGKYKDLISQAVNPNITMSGINDKPIGVDLASRDDSYKMSNVPIEQADLRTLIQVNSNNDRMAQTFAVAELVLTNDLSRAVHISTPGMRKLLLNDNSNASHVFDEHQTGSMPSLLLNSVYHRVLSTCLLELIDRYKSKGIFDDTVIQLAGEFNRSPKNVGNGSDHGIQATSASIFSGAIKKPLIIGNVRHDAPVGGHTGSWGYQASNSGGFGLLNTGHLGASMANILRIPSPVTAASSVISVDGNGVTSLIGKAEQKAS